MADTDTENEKRDPPSQPQLSPPASHEPVEHLNHKQAAEELNEAIKGGDEVIVKITTALQLRPIVARLDRAKITISQKSLFGSKVLISLPMNKVSHVSAEVGAITGFIKVDKEVLNEEEPYKFGPFWRSDALKFAKIAEGYVMALERKIELSALTIKELRKKLQEFGEA